MASYPSSPKPLSEKITSISSDPVNSILINRVGKPATTISMAFRKDVFVKNLVLCQSFGARCQNIWFVDFPSRNEFFVSIVRLANPPITIAVTGKVICQNNQLLCRTMIIHPSCLRSARVTETSADMCRRLKKQIRKTANKKTGMAAPIITAKDVQISKDVPSRTAFYS